MLDDDDDDGREYDWADTNEPYWTTRDGRHILMRNMDDKHIENTVRFLRARGVRTAHDFMTDPLALTEFALSGGNVNLQTKLVQLEAEQARRQKVSPTTNLGSVLARAR